MSAATGVIRVIARSLPARVRDRYREEWLADLEGSREVGLSEASVVGAAAITAITMDRTDASITGIPRAELAKRRASWAIAFLGSATVLAVGLFLWGGYQQLSIVLPGLGLIINAVGLVVGLATAVFLMLGVVAAIGAATAAADAHGARMLRYVGIGAAVLAIALFCLVLSPVLGALGTVAAIATVMVIAPQRGGPEASAPAPRAKRILLALPFSAATIAAVTFGVLHITVWNPLAKLPDMTLDEIYAAMDAAGQGTGSAIIIAWATFWSLAAIALPVLCTVPRLDRALDRRRIVVIGLLLVGGTIVFQWVAGFSMGMNMADTFYTTGGDAAPTGQVLTIVGQVALVAALLAGLAPRRLSSREAV